MTPAQTAVLIASLVVAWVSGLLILAFRIGRFEASTTARLLIFEDSRKENKTAIERTETVLRAEIKELRRDIQTRLDDLLKEVVRQK